MIIKFNKRCHLKELKHFSIWSKRNQPGLRE